MAAILSRPQCAKKLYFEKVSCCVPSNLSHSVNQVNEARVIFFTIGSDLNLLALKLEFQKETWIYLQTEYAYTLTIVYG